jgi:hypothetical protein
MNDSDFFCSVVQIQKLLISFRSYMHGYARLLTAISTAQCSAVHVHNVQMPIPQI